MHRNFKRLSNNETVNLIEPLYIQWDGIYGYLVESNGDIYHIYAIDGEIYQQCVTKYFELM